MADRDDMAPEDRMAAVRDAADARRAFSLALSQHLENSRTGFARTRYDIRSDADLAVAVGVRLRTVQSWLNPNGRLLPTDIDIDKILEVFFADIQKFAASARRLKVVWTEAEALARRARLARLPTTPSPGPGPEFAPTAVGYEISAAGMTDAERADATQTRLYNRIQERIRRLTPLLASIDNSHPLLASEIADYIALVDVGLDALDIPTAWSVGSALGEMLTRLTAPIGSMTPALEPETLAMLNALVHDHIALIQGFSTGRALTRRVAEFQQAAKPAEPIRHATHAVLEAIQKTPKLLARRARRLVDAILRALQPAQTKTLQLTVAANEVAYNFMISVSRYLQSFEHVIKVNAEATLALTFFGAEHIDLLETSIALFRDHGAAVLTFAAIDGGQNLDWLQWWVASLDSRNTVEVEDVADWEDIDED